MNWENELKGMELFIKKTNEYMKSKETVPMSVIEDIKAEMESRIGTYYQIGERTDKNGTTIVDLKPYDKGTIEQMIRIIDEHIGKESE